MSPLFLLDFLMMTLNSLCGLPFKSLPLESVPVGSVFSTEVTLFPLSRGSCTSALELVPVGLAHHGFVFNGSSILQLRDPQCHVGLDWRDELSFPYGLTGG